MKVVNSVYNVLTILIEDALTAGTKKVVGTSEDFRVLKKVTKKSGIIVVQATVGEEDFISTLTANLGVNDTLVCNGVATYDSKMSTVTAVFEDSDDGMKVTVTIIPLS